MPRIRKILFPFIKHKLILTIFLILTAILVAFFFQYSNLQKNRNLVLENFYKLQIEKKQNLEQTYQSIVNQEYQDQAKNNLLEQKQVEEIDKSLKPNLPTCDKLQNRNNIIIYDANCTYSIKATGAVNLAVVLVADDPTNLGGAVTTLENPDGNENSFTYLNSFIKKEAARYNVKAVDIKLTFFGPYKITKSVRGLNYLTQGSDIYNELSKTSELNKVPEKDYDLVHYVYSENGYGGMAFPGSHRAFTEGYSQVGVFLHETIHLFGATDKYNNNDCNTIGRANPFDKTSTPQDLFDIMCRLYPLKSAIINTITAREIGWTN